MRQRTREVALSLAAASIVVVGCSGSTETAETAPTPGTDVVESTATGSLPESTDATAVTTSVETDPPTTPATETTETDTTAAAEEPFLSDVPGRLVDTAPNVNSAGEIYELMPKLWLFIPSEPDPNDPNVIVPSPEDAEILAAYARYTAAAYARVDAGTDSARTVRRCRRQRQRKRDRRVETRIRATECGRTTC